MTPAVAAADDYGNTFAKAALVALARDGSGSRSGRIDYAGDADMFRFVAPASGQMTIRQSVVAGAAVDPYLYVYGSGQRLLASNDDYGATRGSRVVVNVTANAAYYVKAAAYGAATGKYVVAFSTSATMADVSGTFAQAATINLAANGSGSRTSRIDRPGDVDAFRFVAPVTGRMTITQSAGATSALDSYLSAYDGNQALLAENDDAGGGSQNSRVEINVTAGTTYFVTAAAYSASTGAYVLQCTTTPIAPVVPVTTSTGAFHIDLVFAGMTAQQQQIIHQAAQRWEQIIVGDLLDVRYNGQTIDDLRVNVSVAGIDGAGGVLGESSVEAQRIQSRLPYLGSIDLDSADVGSMQAEGSLLGVVEHELGHLLGIGSIWEDLGLLAGAGTRSPRFTGSRATAEYNAIFHASVAGVPVEADGGPGTALSHWNENVLGAELMTGWYDGGRLNPISRITVASLADMGYHVNMAAANAYAPAGTVRLAATSRSSSDGVLNNLTRFPQASLSDSQVVRHRRAVDLVFAPMGLGLPV